MSGILLWFAGFGAGLLVPALFRRRRKGISVDDNGHWHFPIDTLAEMLAVPAERRERFLTELPLTLRRIWELQGRYPLVTLPGAVWVDDGLGELRPNITNAPPHVADAFAPSPLDRTLA